MESLILNIAATEDTPAIVYNPDGKEFLISGRSLPEDVTSFYKPVFEWLEKFSAASASATFKFKLEYFNTASSKIILDILMKLEDLLNDAKNNITIEWLHYDGDDDMQEAGEEYKELVEVPFKIIAY